VAPTIRHTRLLATLAIIAVTGCGSDPPPAAAQAERTLAVVTDIAESREYTAPIETIGTARARESVFITSRASGRVSRIYLTEGARARQGDPIVLLEDDAERASFRSTAAAAAEAQAQLERIKSLAERGLVSQYELDRQRRSVETTQAELELARVRLDQRTIRAPFDGVVGFRQVSPGTLVQPGTPIVSLDHSDEMRVHFSVPETQIASVQSTDRVEAVTAAYPGRVYEGRIVARGTRVDEVTRAVPAQAVFDNRDGSLLPGMLLSLRIMARPRQLTCIPEGALAPDQARQFVWRIDEQNSAQRVEVHLGVRAQGWVEILSGIRAGDRVVVEGVESLRPGSVVREAARPAPALASDRTKDS
jgi:membrane fusion protein (multidrug efflux system)